MKLRINEIFDVNRVKEVNGFTVIDRSDIGYIFAIKPDHTALLTFRVESVRGPLGLIISWNEFSIGNLYEYDYDYEIFKNFAETLDVTYDNWREVMAAYRNYIKEVAMNATDREVRTELVKKMRISGGSNNFGYDEKDGKIYKMS